MHKKMLALSALCRERGDPPSARRAIGRSQCNDAYWHGVFGGLYLPFLRAEIWRNLALAESELRQGEALRCERLDIDGDGHDELWIHSASFSAIVSPARGGAIEELTRFALGENLCDVLTRRRESYHVTALRKPGEPDPGKVEGKPASAPSIHDIEAALALSEMPPIDMDDRALFIERVLDDDVTKASYADGAYSPLASGARLRMVVEVDPSPTSVAITMRSPDSRIEKRLTFFRDGSVRAKFTWDVTAFPAGAWFTTELSLSRAHALTTVPVAEVWEHPIETVAKSERGLDRTLQGTAYLVRWPVHAGAAEVRLEVRDQA